MFQPIPLAADLGIEGQNIIVDQAIPHSSLLNVMLHWLSSEDWIGKPVNRPI